MKATKTVNVAAGTSHQRSVRSVLTPMRARVGPFTPVEPRVSVDAIVILRSLSSPERVVRESAHSHADVKVHTPEIEDVLAVDRVRIGSAQGRAGNGV